MDGPPGRVQVRRHTVPPLDGEPESARLAGVVPDGGRGREEEGLGVVTGQAEGRVLAGGAHLDRADSVHPDRPVGGVIRRAACRTSGVYPQLSTVPVNLGSPTYRTPILGGFTPRT